VECCKKAGSFEGDSKAIRSMLVNLLENSIDACRLDSGKAHYKVTLAITSSDDEVRFLVRDNGIGMDQETREKAFTLFFSSKGTEGTGLGLFISNRIAHSHGGRIELESKVGEGTEFHVILPRRHPSELG
jgi:signal transduction histidine kinase